MKLKSALDIWITRTKRVAEFLRNINVLILGKPQACEDWLVMDSEGARLAYGMGKSYGEFRERLFLQTVFRDYFLCHWCAAAVVSGGRRSFCSARSRGSGGDEDAIVPFVGPWWSVWSRSDAAQPCFSVSHFSGAKAGMTKALKISSGLTTPLDVCCFHGLSLKLLTWNPEIRLRGNNEASTALLASRLPSPGLRKHLLWSGQENRLAGSLLAAARARSEATFLPVAAAAGSRRLLAPAEVSLGGPQVRFWFWCSCLPCWDAFL